MVVGYHHFRKPSNRKHKSDIFLTASRIIEEQLIPCRLKRSHIMKTQIPVDLTTAEPRNAIILVGD